MLATPRNIKLKNAQRREIYQSSIRKGDRYSERELKEMMEENGKVKIIKSRKSSYGSSFNESMVCYNDEQEGETAIVEINKYRGWTAELYQSYFQKQHSHKQNNIQKQDATEESTKSMRQGTSGGQKQINLKKTSSS